MAKAKRERGNVALPPFHANRFASKRRICQLYYSVTSKSVSYYFEVNHIGLVKLENNGENSPA